MKNRAFTLMEVLVAVLIISIVATALFQIAINSKYNFGFLTQKIKFDTMSSIAFLHNKQKWHNSDKRLYDFLRSDYNISDDEFIKILKSEKIHYSHEEFSTISPFESSDSNVSDMMNLQIVFDKIQVSQKEQSSYVYKIYIRN